MKNQTKTYFQTRIHF